MTAIRKTNKKSYFERNSLYDDFLKKNHPDNIRKTLLKSKFRKNYETLNKNNIEDIKEKDEIESDKEEKKEKDKQKKLDQLKYSLSFDDEDENNEENNEESENIDIIDKDGDSKLLNLLNNDDNEEIKELKKLYYGDNLKESINFLKKSIVKKKTLKFNENLDNNEKEKKNIEIKRVGTNKSDLDMDKYEEKIKEYNKILDFSNNKEEINKLDTHLEKSFHNDNNEKSNFINFNIDKAYNKKLNFETDTNLYNINDINNLLKKINIVKYNDAIPCKKIKDIDDSDDINYISSINELFLKKYKRYLNNNNKKIYKKNETDCFQPKTNNISNKVDESTQTNLINNNILNKYKIVRSFFSIKKSNIIKYETRLDNDNYPYMYNGNNQININKINNPIRLNYNKSQIFSKTGLITPNKVQRYLNDNNRNNSSFDINIIKTNSCAFNKSPILRNKNIKNNNIMNSIDYTITSDNQRTYIQNKNDNSYIKQRNKRIKLENCNDFSQTLPREKSACNTVKNAKKEVIVKRNEIIEKIQHCQNLLNTIMIDKKYSLANMINIRNNNQNKDNMNKYNYEIKKKNSKISEFNMNKSNKINNNNGINQMFQKNSLGISSNNPNQINNNNKYTYKKINIKYLDKNKNDIYSFDNINRDNIYNNGTSQENYYFNNDNSFLNTLTQKAVKKYYDDEQNLNNCSYDAPHKRTNKLNIKTGYNFPLYMNNKRKMNDNPLLNKTFDQEENDNDIFTKNVYKTKNINVNNKNLIFKKLKGYKDLNFN